MKDFKMGWPGGGRQRELKGVVHMRVLFDGEGYKVDERMRNLGKKSTNRNPEFRKL